MRIKLITQTMVLESQPFQMIELFSFVRNLLMMVRLCTVQCVHLRPLIFNNESLKMLLCFMGLELRNIAEHEMVFYH